MQLWQHVVVGEVQGPGPCVLKSELLFFFFFSKQSHVDFFCLNSTFSGGISTNGVSPTILQILRAIRPWVVRSIIMPPCRLVRTTLGRRLLIHSSLGRIRHELPRGSNEDEGARPDMVADARVRGGVRRGTKWGEDD